MKLSATERLTLRGCPARPSSHRQLPLITAKTMHHKDHAR